MNRTYFLLAAGLMCHAALAQTQPATTAYQQAFQQAQSLAGGRGRGAAMPLLREEAGKPFSATVTNQSTQTLSDGTRVSQTTTMVEYRDAEGRVRTETSQPAASGGQMKIITIRDPVAGVSYRLDPAQRSAIKLATPMPVTAPAGVGRGRSANAPEAIARTPQGGAVAVEAADGGRGRGGSAPQELLQRLQEQLVVARASAQELQAARTNPNDIFEDLGTITVNGVAARGTRTTTVVPIGAIGNDREFRSISERWFSSDLNLLVKSVNTDPRFGTTTYELTNISRQPPDPSLFQVPADYNINIVSTGGRGGR